MSEIETNRLSTSPILFDEKLGAWYREGTTHLKIVTEPRREYKLLDIRPGDRLMDIGAHIGSFLLWAIRKGGGFVESYEPTPDTFEVLERNADLYKDQCRIHRAIVNQDGADSQIWLSKYHDSKGSSCVMTDPSKVRTPLNVQALSFQSEMERIQPHLIKCDIEGGEYKIDFSRLTDSVRQIVLELHWLERRNNREKALHLISSIESQGFVEVLKKSGKPAIEGRGFNWNITLERK